MKRREFLTASTAAATAFALAPQLPAANPSRRLRAGFLGGAHSHASTKWRLVRESPDYELVGMAEESATLRAEYATHGAKFFPPDELLTACEVIFVESAVADQT